MFTYSVSIFMAFLAQKLIYTFNIWCNFVFGSFFWWKSCIKLNYFSSVCKKMTRCVCAHFKTETDVAQNLIDDFSFLTLTVRGPFHRKNFSEKNMGVQGWFLKTKKRKQNLTKEQKQPPVVILQQVILYNIFILFLRLRIITRCE